LHPLGIISHSSCGLEPFLDGILDYKLIMEYRIGVVHTVEHHLTPPGRHYLLIQLVNGRGVENWVRLEMEVQISGASVSFATTKQALTRNMRPASEGGNPIVEDTLSVTCLARQFKVLCDHVNGVDINRPEESEDSLCSLLGNGNIPRRWTLTEDALLRHHLEWSRFHR